MPPPPTRFDVISNFGGSPEEYQVNVQLANEAQAKLENFRAMNEAARKAWQEKELERQIEAGKKAERQLQALRSSGTRRLGLEGPSNQQNPYVANQSTWNSGTTQNEYVQHPYTNDFDQRMQFTAPASHGFTRSTYYDISAESTRTTQPAFQQYASYSQPAPVSTTGRRSTPEQYRQPLNMQLVIQPPNPTYTAMPTDAQSTAAQQRGMIHPQYAQGGLGFAVPNSVSRQNAQSYRTPPPGESNLAGALDTSRTSNFTSEDPQHTVSKPVDTSKAPMQQNKTAIGTAVALVQERLATTSRAQQNSVSVPPIATSPSQSNAGLSSIQDLTKSWQDFYEAIKAWAYRAPAPSTMLLASTTFKVFKDAKGQVFLTYLLAGSGPQTLTLAQLDALIRGRNESQPTINRVTSTGPSSTPVKPTAAPAAATAITTSTFPKISSPPPLPSRTPSQANVKTLAKDLLRILRPQPGAPVEPLAKQHTVVGMSNVVNEATGSASISTSAGTGSHTNNDVLQPIVTQQPEANSSRTNATIPQAGNQPLYNGVMSNVVNEATGSASISTSVGTGSQTNDDVLQPIVTQQPEANSSRPNATIPQAGNQPLYNGVLQPIVTQQPEANSSRTNVTTPQAGNQPLYNGVLQPIVTQQPEANSSRTNVTTPQAGNQPLYNGVLQPIVTQQPEANSSRTNVTTPQAGNQPLYNGVLQPIVTQQPEANTSKTNATTPQAEDQLLSKPAQMTTNPSTVKDSALKYYRPHIYEMRSSFPHASKLPRASISSQPIRDEINDQRSAGLSDVKSLFSERPQTPLFLPSPSSLPAARASPVSDLSLDMKTTQVTKRSGPSCYVLVPAPPEWVRKYKTQQLGNKRRRISASVADSESGKLDLVLSGSSTMDQDGQEIEVIDLDPANDLAQGCQQTFRTPRQLVKHHHDESEHHSNALKLSAELVAPTLKPPADAPPLVIPSYLVEPVKQPQMTKERHATLGPWVLRQIVGPVTLEVKRYNAARKLQQSPSHVGKRGSQPYDFLSFPSTNFSASPSQPSKIRDLRDISSAEVSDMVHNGLVFWGPKKEEEKKDEADISQDALQLSFSPISGAYSEENVTEDTADEQVGVHEGQLEEKRIEEEQMDVDGAEILFVN
ncbi:hypothetical protein H0H87_000759 [Tephrocybe sp. NHM501043]|nr:hypothetical protein H0H87_000759 [Tephrocybe sp. NHM501043]